MPIIQETFEIKFSPETVFDLIDEVEKTSNYSEILKGVQEIGPDVYRYSISVAGIPLVWDAKVTERTRPKRISWVSLRGISLEGSFTLKPTDTGTKVFFAMEYNIRNRLLAMVLNPFISPLAKKVASETIRNIKKGLDKSSI
ncbi:MAG: type II toxin-antitoxin system RatA family toxin [Mariprofundaceae bacterium]